MTVYRSQHNLQVVSRMCSCFVQPGRGERLETLEALEEPEQEEA